MQGDEGGVRCHEEDDNEEVERDGEHDEVEAVDDGDEECESFAGARSRLCDHVLTREKHRYRGAFAYL